MLLRSDDTVLNPKFGVDILKTATCRSWQPKALHKIGEKTSDGGDGGGGGGGGGTSADIELYRRKVKNSLHMTSCEDISQPQ